MSTQDEILADHQRMWRGFCRFTAVGVAVVVLILALMGIFLVWL